MARKRELYGSRDPQGRWIVGCITDKRNGRLRVIDRYTLKADADAHAAELVGRYAESWGDARVFDLHAQNTVVELSIWPLPEEFEAAP